MSAFSSPAQHLPDHLKNCLRTIRDHLHRPRWGDNKPVRFLTSFNEVLFEASGKQCLAAFRHYNPQWPIVSYIEARQLEALPALESELQSEKFEYVLLDNLPLLNEFFQKARDVIPVSLGGDAPESMFPGQGPSSESWFRKHMYRWFRKIVALDHAAADYNGILVWMDCDCFAVAPMPQSALEAAFGNAGVFHMKGSRAVSEAGLVGYDLTQPGVRELIEGMKTHYLTPRFRDYDRWDDSYVFDIVRAQLPDLRCRDIGRQADKMGNILDSSLLAPYLTHDKGLHSRKLHLVE